MAKLKGAISPRKKAKSGFARSTVVKRAQSLINRIFCKRSIIIIADHKTHHVPFSAGLQAFGAVAAISLMVWASYSSGSYMAAQRILEEKDRKLANSTRENMRVAAEFTLLKSDLMKLSTGGKGKSSDVAKILAEHDGANPLASNSGDTGSAEADEIKSQYEAVFKRVEFLDNKVRELQTVHDEMIADIRATTGGKIRELESVIARTGISAQPLEKAAVAKREQDEQFREKYGRIENAAKRTGQGGPFMPARSSSLLKERETELYFNLQRLMALNDIVSTMPLAVPLKDHDYRQTSSFGNRRDPFRGTGAFHSGVDLAGPEHAKVLATSDGKVEFSGWQAAYGNMVDIKHPYGLSTRYGHLERVLVQPEQFVKKGQVIGIQGSTGRSTGHHLHYEVRYQGRAIDPGKFLKAGADVRAVN